MADADVRIQLRGRKMAPHLPGILAPKLRAMVETPDPFLPSGYLVPQKVYDVSAAARGALEAADLKHEVEANELLVVELADGSSLITSAARLRASLERSHPEMIGTDGAILFEKLRIEGSTPRRGFSEAITGLVSKVFTFVTANVPDLITEQLKGQLALGVSWAGTKALMWAIESLLDRKPGLYRWTGAGLKNNDLEPINDSGLIDSASKPMLVFIHGTASSTHGSFGDLCDATPEAWSELKRRYSGGIYAFEHRTLSESPIENAIALVKALPPRARVSLVTHSRGGLVADLLCLREFDGAIQNYKYSLKGTGDTEPQESERVKGELAQAHEQHRELLRELASLLRQRELVIERYARVACPASGTKLVGNNLDLFLSGLLTLIGQVPYLFGSPIYSALKRVVIEIAKNRTNPHLVPGVEAMLPDSPMARLLRDSPVQDGIRMSIIAGDIEGGNLLQRLGVMLTDYLIFDKEDNDLVVDTRAMLTGVASKAKARVLFDRGSAVSHFAYFKNRETGKALRDWLVADDPSKLQNFRALPSPEEYAAALAAALHRGVNDPERPVVVVLPGIMGSHLRRGPNDRVWFDPLDLATGGLRKIAWPQACDADEIFGMFYGKLCEHLAQSHRVERFAYDWRQPLDVLAGRLGDFLSSLLGTTQQPVRLLAHSMGGLVVRACIHRRRPIMDALMQREGARLVMLGTPNQGAHSMVENLLGKGDNVRALATLDFADSLQEVLNIVGGFRGALQLLPKPGFVDTFQGQVDGGERFEFQKATTWVALQSQLKDFWFGDGHCAIPDQAALDAGSWLWGQDGTVRPSLPDTYKDKSVYVFGLARNTPCGVRKVDGRIKMVGTTRGDGQVTWESGRIDGIGAFFYMPVSHAALTCTEAHFAAVTDLLSSGNTTRLGQHPPAQRSIEKPSPIIYDAGPPSVVDSEGLERGLMGGAPQDQVPPRPKHRLEIRVKATDLRFVTTPILVGHYEHDPIAGPEALIDRELLRGDLSIRHSLGLYAGPRGSAAVVLRVPNELERRRGSFCGAVVAGLGSYEVALTSTDLTDAVRAGVLRYLLQVVDLMGKSERLVSLSALLLGYNSSANLSVSASVEAIVRGVVEANHKFRETTQLDICIEHLDLIELYLDTAITAVYALRNLAPELAAHAEKHDATLVCCGELEEGAGARHRLFDSSGAGYWPRLLVTSAARGIAKRGDEQQPIDKSKPQLPEAAGESSGPPAKDVVRAPLADQLWFLYVGQRARAESVIQQRQPGLIETLVRQQIHSNVWQEDLGRMLFQLMIPPDLKDAARQLERLVLVLDDYTANLPWELMLADDPVREGDRRPLAIRTAVVRQLASTEFRRQVRQGIGHSALVIGNPSLEGLYDAFPSLKKDTASGGSLPQLPGAEDEANTVAGLLRGFGYDVTTVIGEERRAMDALSALCQKPWRILHVSAHGVFGLPHSDGQMRSGVLLSDGLLITAAEIHAMELVPEVVFLNCCHLGTVDITRDGNKFAASIALELINIGVRCVVVAGWAVNDQCARIFGETFYKELLLQQRTFGDAVFEARKAVWDAQQSDITWGAFQAYGDPGWLAEPRADRRDSDGKPESYASVHECLAELSQRRTELAHNHALQTDDAQQNQMDQIANLLKSRCPQAWQNLPVLQSTLASTYKELASFKEARAAFLSAIRAHDEQRGIPIRDIEQLINTEARWGERLAQRELAGDSDTAIGPDALSGEALIDLAIHRLAHLESLVSPRQVSSVNAEVVPDSISNSERAALLGGAWKRKASIYARRLKHGIPPEQAHELREQLNRALKLSVRAYRSAEGDPAGADFSPYNALNRLALDAFTAWATEAEKESAAALAEHCSKRACARFAVKADVWDALMQAEALMVAHLIRGSFRLDKELSDEAYYEVVNAYAATTAHLTLTPMQLDSVTAQFELLATFCDALTVANSDNGWRDVATRLRMLGAALQSSQADGPDRVTCESPTRSPFPHLQAT